MNLPYHYESLTQEQRRLVREEYVRIQDGKCQHCGTLLTEQPAKDRPLDLRIFPKGFLAYPVHLHHSHDTGLTIGAVHSYCNGILWQYHGE